MDQLTPAQKKYLKGLAHRRKAVVFIGRQGLTPAVVGSVEQALLRHELIKVKFIEFKEKTAKTSLAEQLAQATGSLQMTASRIGKSR